MAQRNMSIVALGVLLAATAPMLSAAVRAQPVGSSSGAAGGSEIGQSNPAMYGAPAPAPVASGTGNNANAAGFASPVAAMMSAVPGAGVPEPAPVGGTSLDVNAPTIHATGSATGTAAMTGSTTSCASMTAVLLVSPAQMSSNCNP
jgi:hypothetical protein